MEHSKEIWKPIIRVNGLYSVSNFGRVRNNERTARGTSGLPRPVHERILKQGITRGYSHVGLSIYGKVKTYRVANLVATEFCKRPKGCNVVNHIDFNRQNNCADNLEWCTQEYNIEHARIGKRFKDAHGENNNSAKLTWESVNEIRTRIKNGETNLAAIGRIYSVSKGTISLINSNKIWKSA